MRVVAVVEARMTSSRLPGKVLLHAAGQPMLAHLLDRLRAAPSIDDIVVATTQNDSDDAIVAVAEDHGVRIHRGSEHDVLGRVAEAIEGSGADVGVHITGDCPIIDPDLVEQTIRVFMANAVAAASNCFVASYPDGMNTTVLRAEAIREAANAAVEDDEREHTLLYVMRHEERYSRIALVAPPSLHWPELGLTLDEYADYLLLKELIEDLNPRNPMFGCEIAIRYLRAHPHLVGLNEAVRRRATSL